MENYNIYDEIGRGAHSFVYKARRKRSIEYVAVKSTSKSRMNKILNEVQILHKFNSRYVLKFYNWYESKNHIWLIFEYCIGGDLLNLITQDKSLPEATVQKFGYELMAGLQYLHANGILFCDLKPANILIDEYGSLKLADFGLARRIPTKQNINSKPLPPSSPNYMAPELFGQPIVHSFASDFWALGCVLFELSTGTQPFINSNFSELARMIQTQELQFPLPGHDMSDDFCDLLTQLLQKNPLKRITWKVLRAHPFWKGLEPLEQVALPRQDFFKDTFARVSLSASGDHSSSEEAKSMVRENNAESPTVFLDRKDVKHQQQRLQAQSKVHSTEMEPQETEEDDNEQNEQQKECPSFVPTKPTGDKRVAAAPRDQNGKTSYSTKSYLVSESDTTLLPGTNEHANGKAHVIRAPRTAPPPAENQPSILRHIRSARARQQQQQQQQEHLLDLRKSPDFFFAELDVAAKAVMVNDEIERVPAPLPKKDSLPFELLSAEELLTDKFDQLKDQLNRIFQLLRAAEVPMDQKLESLSYLLQLVMDQRLAIIVANSSILVLLMKLLRDTFDKDDEQLLEFATRVCLVLGIIAFCLKKGTPVGASNHMKTLVETLVLVIRSTTQEFTADLTQSQERDLQVLSAFELQRSMLKRRAVACCGELVCFLTSTKLSASQTFLKPAIQCLLSKLIDGDAVTRHYALRTFSNLMVGGVDPALMDQFSHEVVPRLLVAGIVTDQSMPIGVKRAHLEAFAMYLFQFFGQSTQRCDASDQIRRLLEETNLMEVLWKAVWDAQQDVRTKSLCLSVLIWFISIPDDEESLNLVNRKKAEFLMQLDLSSLLKFIAAADVDDRNETEVSGVVVLQAKLLLLLTCGYHASEAFAQSFAERDFSKVTAALLERDSTLAGSSFDNPGIAVDLYHRAIALNAKSGKQVDSQQYLVQCCLYLNCHLATSHQ